MHECRTRKELTTIFGFSEWVCNSSRFPEVLELWVNDEYCTMVKFCPFCGYQPERSKREDLGHGYCYRLVDGSFETAKEMVRGYIFSKEEAVSWVNHGANRAYHELLICNVFPKMRCSEHCGNIVKEVQ